MVSLQLFKPSLINCLCGTVIPTTFVASKIYKVQYAMSPRAEWDSHMYFWSQKRLKFIFNV